MVNSLIFIIGLIYVLTAGPLSICLLITGFKGSEEHDRTEAMIGAGLLGTVLLICYVT